MRLGPHLGLACALLKVQLCLVRTASLCHRLMDGACRELVLKCRAVGLRLPPSCVARLRKEAMGLSLTIPAVVRVAQPHLRLSALGTSRLAQRRSVPVWSIAHAFRWHLPEEPCLTLPLQSKPRRRKISGVASSVSPLTPLSKLQCLSRMALATFHLRVVDGASRLGWHRQLWRQSILRARSLGFRCWLRTALLPLSALHRHPHLHPLLSLAF